MTINPDEIDWSLTTWEGTRREQLRRSLHLTLRERLQALEEMAETARRLQESLYPERAGRPPRRQG